MAVQNSFERGIRALTMLAAAAAAAGPGVIVRDHGEYTRIAGPGAPKHVIGLRRLFHTITLDTGVRKYGLEYTVARDPKRPGIAIPAEGYIGMPAPSPCNWYAGGFFDLRINGKSIGRVPVAAFSGRGSGDRGYVDFIFPAPSARVRVRFVALAGRDPLYAQVRLEPKRPITKLEVGLTCFPSIFSSRGERHVLTPRRDLAQGQAATLHLPEESWLLYYDRVFDQGRRAGRRTGVGPCAVLWPGKQPRRVRFTVGSYGIHTLFDFDPSRRELRFLFFDFAGTRNADAIAALRRRAPALDHRLQQFSFTDPELLRWPFEQKKRELAALLARLPENDKTRRDSLRRQAALARDLRILRSGAAGAIQAESEAVKIIHAWDAGIPALKLRILLDSI